MHTQFWNDFSQDWPAALELMRCRFPDISVTTLPCSRLCLARLIAQTHDLTLIEAEEELRDFLYIEALRRESELDSDPPLRRQVGI
jgi:hypothetical protein